MVHSLQVLVIVFHVNISKQSVLLNEEHRAFFCCSCQVLILMRAGPSGCIITCMGQTKKCIILVVLKSSPLLSKCLYVSLILHTFGSVHGASHDVQTIWIRCVKQGRHNKCSEHPRLLTLRLVSFKNSPPLFKAKLLICIVLILYFDCILYLYISYLYINLIPVKLLLSLVASCRVWSFSFLLITIEYWPLDKLLFFQHQLSKDPPCSWFSG